MSKGFESARADAMKTCGAEIQGDNYVLDANSAFDSAKKNLEKKMGFIDRKLGGVDKEFGKISETLAKNGQAACGQVAEALSGSWKGEINLAAPKVQPSKTAQAKPTAEPSQTARMDLGNITAYAAGTSRTDRMMKEMGI
jgi:hypothetical protein